MICGNGPTVRSHIFPAALIKRIKADEKHVVAGSIHRSGVRFSQSGFWRNDLLCDKHERQLSDADDYACRLTRRVDSLAEHLRDGRVEVPNARPDLLMKFAASIVWRHAAASVREGREYGLGPYLMKFENYVFRHQNFDFEVLMGRSNIISPQGQKIEMAIAPYRNRMSGRNIWQFTIGGLDYYVRTDKSPFPKDWHECTAGSELITLLSIDAQSIHKIPKFSKIFRNMATPSSQTASA